MTYLDWQFPLPRTHCGALLGNGCMGLMVWGEDSLMISVGRAGFWDHRGANDFSARGSYAQVKALLEARDEAGLKDLFAVPQKDAQDPPCPTQLGLGCIEICFPNGIGPRSMRLDTRSGTLSICVGAGPESELYLILRQSMHNELAWMQIPQELQGLQLRIHPSWQWIHADRSRFGMQPPTLTCDQHSGAMLQSLPEDDPAALAYRLTADHLMIASGLGADALEQAQARLREDALESELAASRAWWQNYQQHSAQASFPDPILQEIWEYGLYKQACLTTPGGIAATLQGPWLESYQVPPWSCDYHFNINIEMIYWPCLKTGHAQHLQPLWDLLHSWLPRLREVGSQFFQDPQALMLPHAVDDRCCAVGSFWTGCIDNACTAWMGQLAWDYYRHTADRAFLAELAWPLLQGAFVSYWSMIEEDADGSLHLPVSVSPEFKGARMDAWGRDASFQLAACHFLARTLPLAADALGKEHDPRWQQVTDNLPLYSCGEHPRTREYPETRDLRIELWQGMDLLESHRHHSHLGGIYPFQTLDPADPQHATIIRNSIFHWVRSGPGAWSGWCVPWASTLMARCGHGDGAVAWLHFWAEHFVNEGRGTLHDAHFFGASTLFQQGSGTAGQQKQQEIMQIEAGQGALNALCELLVQERNDGIHVYPARVAAWQELSFSGIHVGDGLVLGAEIRQGQVVAVQIRSTRSTALRLWHGLGTDYLCMQEPCSGALLQRELKAGEELRLESVNTSGTKPQGAG